MSRKDWTIYKEQNTSYGESNNTQGQHHMVRHQTPHENTSRNQNTRAPRHSRSQQVNGGPPGDDPDDDPSEDPSDPPDLGPDDDPDPDDSGEETDTSEELG